MYERIAFFDFDGTLTTKDTLLEFIRFSKGTPRFYLGFALNSPWLVAYKLRIISNQAAKERILTWFFGNSTLESFQQHCDGFRAKALPSLLRPKGLQEIDRLKAEGSRVIIVSASPENWIGGWAESLGIEVIATRLATSPPAPASPLNPASETAAGTSIRLTGRISGLNCHGQEKVRRIKESFSLEEYREIYAYGDSSGDKPMLNLASRRFYKPFR